MTLKIHVIIHHYSEYFHWTGKTMKYTNAKFTETVRSTFKMSESFKKNWDTYPSRAGLEIPGLTQFKEGWFCVTS